MAIDISRAHFEVLVDRAVASIPTDLAKHISNVAVLVEDESPTGGPTLLGLYQGIPLTVRGSTSYAGVMPDRITIYQGPITRRCNNLDDVIEQVRITVVHELAHHFGIDDDRLEELGYG